MVPKYIFAVCVARKVITDIISDELYHIRPIYLYKLEKESQATYESKVDSKGMRSVDQSGCITKTYESQEDEATIIIWRTWYDQ